MDSTARVLFYYVVRPLTLGVVRTFAGRMAARFRDRVPVWREGHLHQSIVAIWRKRPRTKQLYRAAGHAEPTVVIFHDHCCDTVLSTVAVTRIGLRRAACCGGDWKAVGLNNANDC